jgi:hypothetical protein
MRLQAIDQFDSLPYFAQALIACRIVRRGVLARYAEGDAERSLILSACDAIEACCVAGDGTHRHKALFRSVMDLKDKYDRHREDREWLRTAAWWMVDATNAAAASNDFPIDGTATRSAKGAIAALGEDRELSRMQITILLAADVDQVRFALGEIGKLPETNIAARYQGVTSHVMGRLAPVHPFTATPYERRGEEAAR